MDAFSVSQIRWSPNGKSIAYTQSSMGTQESSFFDLNADRNSDIYVVASDGGAPKRLTTNAGPDSNPEWSPDGNEISYVSAMNANHLGRQVRHHGARGRGRNASQSDA